MATNTDTIESLRHQRNLLAEALGRVLIFHGVIRADAALTGPELLLAAETACLPDNVLEITQTDYDFARERVGQIFASNAFLANEALDSREPPAFCAFFKSGDHYFRSIEGYTAAEFRRQWPE